MEKIVKKRLEEAEQHLEEAEFIYKENIGNLQVMTKLYHAMVYSLFALFEIEDIRNLTHADLIARFERELVQKETFGRSFHEALIYAHGFIHECDCTHHKQPEEGDIDRIVPIVKEFIRNTEGFIMAKRSKPDQ